MKLMHTRLPDFLSKMKDAAKKRRDETEFSVRGLESYASGKLASLRVGRVEDEIHTITESSDIKKVEVILVPDNPEIHLDVIIKAYDGNGKCRKAILENMYITVPSCEYELFDAEEIDDRRTGNRQ